MKNTAKLSFLLAITTLSALAEAAPMTAEDRLGIMDLISRYVTRIDSGDLDGYVANFAPNGTIEWANGRAEGHDAIRNWVGGLMAAGIGATPAQVRHFVSLPYITGDSERGTAQTYVIVFGLDASGNVTVPSVGSYTDTVVKVDGKWLFEKRIMLADLGVFGKRPD